MKKLNILLVALFLIQPLVVSSSEIQNNDVTNNGSESSEVVSKIPKLSEIEPAESLAMSETESKNVVLTFMLPNETKPFKEIDIKLGSVLEGKVPDPNVSNSKMTFEGWYTADGEKAQLDQAVEKSETYYAKFIEKITITFLDTKGNKLDEKEVNTGEEIIETEKKVSNISNDQQFDYWYDSDGDETVPFVFGSKATKDLKLAPKVSSKLSEVSESQNEEKELVNEKQEIADVEVRDEVSGEEKENALISFVLPGENNPFDEVVYKVGDKLEKPATEPEVPSNMAAFEGWFTEDGKPAPFGENIEKSVTYYAKFKETFTITFLDNKGKEFDKREVEPGERISETDKELSELPEGSFLDYWYNVEEGEKIAFTFEMTTASKDITLAPKLVGTHTLRFVSEGQQKDPRQVEHGKKIADIGSLGSVTRKGYTFKHWSLEKDGETPINKDYIVNDNTVLYAVWTAKEVSYNVVFAIEKRGIKGDPGLDEDNYEVTPFNTKLVDQLIGVSKEDEAELRKLLKGVAGKELTVSNELADNLKKNYMSQRFSQEFKYTEYAFSEEKKVSGNGDTMIIVYYKYINYDFFFRIDNKDGRLEKNGKTYKSSLSDKDKYHVKAKIFEDISEKFPLISELHIDNDNYGLPYLESSSPHIGYGKVSFDMTTLRKEFMPEPDRIYKNKVDVDIKWNKRDKEQVNFKVRYMKFTTDDTGEKNPNPKNGQEDYLYKELWTKEFSADKGSNIETSKFKESDYGIEPPSIKGVEEGKTYTIYAIGESTTLYYNHNGGSANGKETSYESAARMFNYLIEPSQDKIPTRKGYKLKGWYDGPTSNANKIDFKKDILTQHLYMIFAHWEKIGLNVKYLDGIKGDVLAEQSVGEGETVSFPQEFVKGKTYVEGKGIFNGWTWYVGNGRYEEYSEDIPVNKDLTLVANWSTTNYKVTYDLGSGTGTVPEDDSKYVLGDKAVVKTADLIVPPSDSEQVFGGWKSNQDSKIYYPGTEVPVNGNIKLTAQYMSKEDTVNVIYHKNVANEEETSTYAVLKNNEMTISSNPFKSDSMIFNDWNENEDGKGSSFEPGTTFKVEDKDINLYATWKNKQVTLDFQAGEGGNISKNIRKIEKANYGSTWGEAKVKIPETFADKGLYFTGWSPELPKDSDKLTKDMKFTAQFAEDKAAIKTKDITIYTTDKWSKKDSYDSGVIEDGKTAIDFDDLEVETKLEETGNKPGTYDVTYTYTSKIGKNDVIAKASVTVVESGTVTVKYVYEDKKTPLRTQTVEEYVLKHDGTSKTVTIDPVNLEDEHYRFLEASNGDKPLSNKLEPITVDFSEQAQIIYLIYQGESWLETVKNDLLFKGKLDSASQNISNSSVAPTEIKIVSTELKPNWQLMASASEFTEKTDDNLSGKEEFDLLIDNQSISKGAQVIHKNSDTIELETNLVIGKSNFFGRDVTKPASLLVGPNSYQWAKAETNYSSVITWQLAENQANEEFENQALPLKAGATDEK